MGKPHVLVVPYAAQGHVIPMMELALCLVKHGFRVTMVNTDFNHKRIMDALSEEDNIGELVHLVSISEGLGPKDNRNDLLKLTEAILEVMPQKLEELIEKLNESDHQKIRCIIADTSMGWALEVAKKMGIKRAAFCPPAAALMALQLSLPKLIYDNIIDSDGIPTKKNQKIQLAPNMPEMNPERLVWACIGDPLAQRCIFKIMIEFNSYLKLVDWVLCNSSYELESGTFEAYPKILPIGPLLASSRLGKSEGYFWPEDSSCLKWLDRQPAGSVIYIAFGSFTVFDEKQFQELALGLELTDNPFLWVVRPDITEDSNESYPQGFKERVGSKGHMVGWAPQQQVLSHPSIACFISHCGWNSTLEGLSNGVPFLCWPYFADQFLNQTYICDVWKVGMSFEHDEQGIVTRAEIKNKVNQLLGDKTFKARALELKEKAMNNLKDGGSSHRNFSEFLKWMEKENN